MAKMQFDPLDAALTIALAATGFMMVGIASFDLFGVAFSETAFTVAGTNLSLAYVISVAALALTVITNDNTELSSLKDDMDRLDDYYKAAVLGTLGLFVAWILVPDVASFFQSQDLWGLIYVGTITTGQFALGWML